MEIPRHWRLKDQRYRLVGEICPRCDEKIFPPRDVCPNCKDEIDRRVVLKVGVQNKLTKVEEKV